MILDFLKECEQAVSLQIDRICEKIKSSQRIMFYGQKDFINCFQYFVSYCHFNQKEVITSMSLSKENQKELFDSLDENDLIIIIDPYVSWNTFKELVFIQNDAINSINKTPAQIIYIGQNSQSETDICLSLPYTYYDYFYKIFFNIIFVLM